MDENIVSGNTTGKITDAVISVFMDAQDLWPNMNELQQESMIGRLDDRIREIVDGMVTLVAAKQYPVIQARVDGVTFKKGIKANLVLSKDCKYRHDLADHADDKVLIVMCETPELFENPNIEADPDQPCLDIPEGDAVTNAVGEILSEADADADEEPLAEASGPSNQADSIGEQNQTTNAANY